MAVISGVESAIQIHIDRGDDINARDTSGLTPLMLAAARNKASVCKLLLAVGADAQLLDPSGRHALDIAYAAGANDAIRAIETAYPSIGQASASERSPASEEKHIGDQAFEVNTIDGDSFDLSGWEAEEEQPPPEGDATLLEAAVAIQSAITEHQPIDTSADWADFDAYLPSRATPLSRSDDSETRERLRLILLRAIREGSVPQSAVDDLTLTNDGEPDSDAAALLGMVINDLGAEKDERFEYSASHESFQVFVTPLETAAEEEAVDEALTFIDNLAEKRNEPFRIYQREFQREALLSAEAEVTMGQTMENGIEKAIDALAAWPSGIFAVLEAAKKVTTGKKPLRWLSAGPQAGDEKIDDGLDIETTPKADYPNQPKSLSEVDGTEDPDDIGLGHDAKNTQDELTAFRTKVEDLAELMCGMTADNQVLGNCRHAITTLSLTRNFLLELTDSELERNTAASLAFRHALNDYRHARDKMVIANLKLVFSIARKYMYSGQPLDDLIQEGNLGLLKAVDRFNWRKGFKFSTYATWWIRQGVSRYVADKSKMIRLPVHLYEQAQRFANASQAFELERRRAPTFEEVAAMVDLPVRKVSALMRASLEPVAIHELYDLDKLIAADEIDQFIVRDPMEIINDAQLCDSVSAVLKKLTNQEQLVLRLRFGVGIHDSMTLAEIGTRLELTRERIRQIETAGLRNVKQVLLQNLGQQGIGGAFPQRQKKGLALTRDSDQVFDIKMRKAKPVVSEPKFHTHIPAVERVEGRVGVVPAALEKLLSHVRAIGFEVEERLDDPDQRIWVQITETPDNHSRKIVRKLLNFGFEFWPGKGYWR